MYLIKELNMHKGETFNTVSHLLGAVLALASVVVFVVLVSMHGDVWKIVSFSIYGVTLFTLYFFSTLYHGLSGKAKSIFSVFDHQAIYLLIAGTYTPFALVTLRGGWGWTLFGVVWGLAVFGCVLDTLSSIRRGKRILPVIIYLVMGWLVLLAIKPLIDNLAFNGFILLALGGLFYSIGVIFYALSNKFTYAHGIWHLFVLAGSVCHFVSIVYYVL